MLRVLASRIVSSAIMAVILRRRKFAAFQNHLRIIVSVMLDGAVDWTGKK